VATLNMLVRPVRLAVDGEMAVFRGPSLHCFHAGEGSVGSMTTHPASLMSDG
jgi:hypothetical protein